MVHLEHPRHRVERRARLLRLDRGVDDLRVADLGAERQHDRGHSGLDHRLGHVAADDRNREIDSGTGRPVHEAHGFEPVLRVFPHRLHQRDPDRSRAGDQHALAEPGAAGPPCEQEEHDAEGAEQQHGQPHAPGEGDDRGHRPAQDDRGADQHPQGRRGGGEPAWRVAAPRQAQPAAVEPRGRIAEDEDDRGGRTPHPTGVAHDRRDGHRGDIAPQEDLAQHPARRGAPGAVWAATGRSLLPLCRGPADVRLECGHTDPDPRSLVCVRSVRRSAVRLSRLMHVVRGLGRTSADLPGDSPKTREHRPCHTPG